VLAVDAYPLVEPTTLLQTGANLVQSIDDLRTCRRVTDGF
jgi:hypothetical protein